MSVEGTLTSEYTKSRRVREAEFIRFRQRFLQVCQKSPTSTVQAPYTTHKRALYYPLKKPYSQPWLWRRCSSSPTLLPKAPYTTHKRALYYP